MKNNNRGFTLMEMLIVVAIIAILVTISIPAFTNQLEKSREAADLANVRSAYAEVMVAACLEDQEGVEKTVQLQQKVDDWQTAGTIDIGGITQADTKNWIGNPVGGGVCEVSYDNDVGIILNWKGGKTGFLYEHLGDLMGPLNDSKLKDSHKNSGGIGGATNYEIDSWSNGSRTKEVKKHLEGTLLDQKDCSWGYYGDATTNKDYLFWSSVNINDSSMKAGDTVPVIIVTPDKKYYIAETKVVKKKDGYNVLAEGNSYTNYINKLNANDAYSSLETAYSAYEKKVSQGPYKDSLPQ